MRRKQMNLISEDYLMHYGVKGMKWGVRHDPYKSARGSFHRGLSKVYSLNERTYRRLGNKTLASMNAAAKNEQLKKAQQADDNKKKNVQAIERANNKKKIAKLEKYQTKLINKAEKNSGNYRKSAREAKNEIDDLKKMGTKSAYWKQHVKNEVDSYTKNSINKYKSQGYTDRDADFWGRASGGVKYLELSLDYDSKHMNAYVNDLTKSRSDSLRLAKQYTNNKKSLMDYTINSSTKKRDIRKVYRQGLSFGE